MTLCISTWTEADMWDRARIPTLYVQKSRGPLHELVIEACCTTHPVVSLTFERYVLSILVIHHVACWLTGIYFSSYPPWSQEPPLRCHFCFCFFFPFLESVLICCIWRSSLCMPVSEYQFNLFKSVHALIDHSTMRVRPFRQGSPQL